MALVSLRLHEGNILSILISFFSALQFVHTAGGIKVKTFCRLVP